MTKEKRGPLRQRMIEDMRIRRMGDKHQMSHIRAIKDFAAFLGQSPDTATPEDLRAYQLHMTDAAVTPSTFNARIVALRFFFGTTCGREEMRRYMQFRTEPQQVNKAHRSAFRRDLIADERPAPELCLNLQPRFGELVLLFGGSRRLHD